MIIAYYSRTGNVRDFVNWYLVPVLGNGYEAKSLEEWGADEPYILATPTYNFGEVPDEVSEWLGAPNARAEYNNSYMVGVIGSGNRNFGLYFGLAADKISADYGVPLIAKYELKGSDKVAEEIKRKIEEVELR